MSAAALSPQRQLVLMGRMRQLVRAGSQLVMSTHSPLLMGYPGARIYRLGEDGICTVRYEETEHYAITRAFLMNPTKMLDELFRDIDADG